ncbi:hypothetical protein [Agromyces archimandritae]|uniref:Uncharacterized protein n=1 Tax=Agromyces archimandritae TaxID=2781962 RepID=A0A975FJU4_9MICO|nr:hypothetical protein [Agromyces archimandritae]QTX03825.1 hypothetical protein G127AT_10895 [Agromyces archimandritae]
MSTPQQSEPAGVPASVPASGTAGAPKPGRVLALVGFALGVLGVLLNAVGSLVYAALLMQGYEQLAIAANVQSVLFAIATALGLIGLVLGIVALTRTGAPKGWPAAATVLGAVIVFDGIVVGLQSLVYVLL